MRASNTTRLRDAVDQLEGRLPRIAALVEDAEASVLTFQHRLPSAFEAAARADS